MSNFVLNRLLTDKLLTSAEKADLEQKESGQPMSLFWELNTIMFLGVTFFTGAAGYLIYQNLESIGHNFLITALCVLDLLLFYYAAGNWQGFSFTKIPKATPFQDYALITASLLFISITGYVQFVYGIFGVHYGVVIFFYSVLFLALAYAFDTRGVLTIALTGFSTWISVVTVNDYSELLSLSQANNWTPVLFWSGIIMLAFALDTKNIKRHFTATWYYFSVSLLYLHLLSELFRSDAKLVPFSALTLLSAISVWYGSREKQYFFIQTAVIGFFISITFMVVYYEMFTSFAGYLMYFILSGLLAISFFARYRSRDNNK